MAELRRAQLTTLSCNVPFSTVVDKSTLASNATPCTSLGVLESKGIHLEQPVKIEPSVRCVLTLFEPDDRTFPEFSYTELIENKKGNIILQDGIEDQPIEDEVAAIARLFEEKYGGENKKKKDRVQDLVDIGYGYDDEDSFIDNSEAYDEFVPATLTTKHGGFYVNSGPLQFRQASDTETDDFTSIKDTHKPPTKRKLNEGEEEKPKKKRYNEPGKIKTAIDSQTGAVSELGMVEQARKKKRKKKKAAGPLSVTNMLRKFQREKEKERQRRQREEHGGMAASGTSPCVPCPADAAGGGGGSGLADPLLSLIGSADDQALIQAASTVDFVMDLDSLLDATVENSPKGQCQHSPEMALVQSSQPEADVQSRAPIPNQGQPQPEVTTNPQPDLSQPQLICESKATAVPLLPEGLPPSLERRIEQLTEAARSTKGESKLKFFTPEINSMLLDVEFQCEDVAAHVRSRVYAYLAWFLPCSRDTLLKRVRKLLQGHMDPMQKLKVAIGRAMPEQMARFHSNCQAHAQIKSSKILEGKDREQKGNIISEDEGLERSGKRGPQKKFRWSEEIRDSLYHVVRAKMDRCEIERTEGQQMDDYLKSFLDNEVKPLWPRGWMQPRILLKESRKILAQPPLLLAKKTMPEKNQPAGSDTPDPLGGAREPSSPRIFPASQGPLPDMGGPLKAVCASRTFSASLNVNAIGCSTPCGAEANNDKKPHPGSQLGSLSAGEQRRRESPVSQELLAAAMETMAGGGGTRPRCWKLGVDLRSPPPPPRCSPATSPGPRLPGNGRVSGTFNGGSSQPVLMAPGAPPHPQMDLNKVHAL